MNKPIYSLLVGLAGTGLAMPANPAQVDLDGAVATGIRGLEINGTTYDVALITEKSGACIPYADCSDPATKDLSVYPFINDDSAGAQAAAEAIVEALNAAGAQGVGSSIALPAVTDWFVVPYSDPTVQTGARIWRGEFNSCLSNAWAVCTPGGPIPGGDTIATGIVAWAAMTRPVAPVAVDWLADPVGGGADAEAVIVTESAGGQVTVADTGSGNPLGDFALNASLKTVDAVALPDSNASGGEDLAVLLNDPATERPRVELWDPFTGKRIRNVAYNTGHEAIALAIPLAMDGSRLRQGAVLAKRLRDGKARLFIRDLETRDPVRTLSFPKTVDAHALVMAPDFSGNGVGEVLVLASRVSDGRPYVLVWDTGGDGRLVHIPLPQTFTGVAHAYLNGPGGVSAVAVIATRKSDGRGRVFVFDALTGASLWATTLSAGRVPIDVAAFESVGGKRLAILQQRLTDDRPLVSVYDSDTGGVVTDIGFEAGNQAVSLTVFPDVSSDAGADPELGALVHKGGGLELQLRDSVSKALVQAIAAP